MKFGEVDIDAQDLEGSILAHTSRLEGGGAVKKGALLSTTDIERLRRGGYERVMVAQLGPGDVHEDEAAARIAAWFEGPSIVASEASTGRCNLHAANSGLLRIDRAAIDAINQVTESITIATLPPDSLLFPKTMVATVKVIPFAVPDSDLARCAAALSSDDAIEVTPLKQFDAGLILTELPGVSQALLERASRAQRARLKALGSRVRREARCAHTIEAVSRAISALQEEKCNPILLLGASAIVDRGDVIPSAVGEAGGRVLHLGMPVDPGNLLMLGSLGETTVFGLPGCARSLAPSGFDRVLRRFCTGTPVDAKFIQQLGVGGLLKETPERPMPRNLSSDRGARKNIAGIVLAAGSSERMGATNKLTVEVEGTPMVARVVDAVRRSGISPVVVVTGHQADAIVAALGARDVRFVHNADYAEGIGASIRTGVGALDEEVDAALIALGDMPWVQTDVIARLVDAFSPGADLSIYIPMYGRKRGNPVLWGSRHFPELEQLSGDIGGKSLFHQHADAICYVDVKSAAVNIDVDTPESLQRLGITDADSPE